MLIFLGVESNLPCDIGRGGGGVKMKFQEQGGDFVWVFYGGRRWGKNENLWP